MLSPTADIVTTSFLSLYTGIVGIPALDVDAELAEKEIITKPLLTSTLKSIPSGSLSEETCKRAGYESAATLKETDLSLFTYLLSLRITISCTVAKTEELTNIKINKTKDTFLKNIYLHHISLFFDFNILLL